MTDILWYNETTGQLQVWFTRSTLSRISRAPITLNGTPVSIGSPWHVVGTNDFDRDGQTDILWHDDVHGYTQIWYMNGTALRNTQNIVYANGSNVLLGAPWQIAGTNDFNGDGRPDLLWRDDADGFTQVWFLNNAVWSTPGVNITTATGALVLVGAPWHVVGTNDFNHDGKPDILWRDETHGLTHVWTMNGTTRLGGANVTFPDGTNTVVGAPWTVVNH